MDNTKKQQKKQSTNWIGWLIFFMLMFGPNMVRPVSQIISQATGGTVTIGANIIPTIISILAVVMVLTSILRAAARYSKRNETTLPTTLSSPSSSSSPSPSWPDMASNTTFSTPPLSTSSSTSSEWSSSGHRNTHATDEGDEQCTSIFDDDDNEAETHWQGGFSRPRQPATQTRWSELAPPVRFEPVITGKAILAAIVTSLLIGGWLAFGGIMSGILP